MCRLCDSEYICRCVHTHVCVCMCPLWGAVWGKLHPLCPSRVCRPQRATSSLQAVVEEAGVPLGGEGVERKVLWLSCGELHVGPVLVLVVLQRLVGTVQGAHVRLGRQLAGDKPLPHDAFRNHGVLFAVGKEDSWRVREGRGCGDHQVHMP